MKFLQLLKNIYSEKQLDIEINAPDRMMHCDREDMLELIGNLLDNACKWAQGKIHIDLNCDNGITIRVADDGPGCSEQAMQSLVNRGLRLDECIEGHGLGLAIVRDITEFYAGTLGIERSARLGGLQVSVRLPKN